MLLCGLNEVQSGMVVGAAVVHPDRVDTMLLSPGVELDSHTIRRVGELGVQHLWVHHDALADLDALVTPELTESRRALYKQLKKDFKEMAGKTVSAGEMKAYEQAVTQLISGLVTNRKIAGLTDLLFDPEANLFNHCSNVAYLSLLAGLELECYIIKQRPKLTIEQARDLTGLGLGAMLHDIGKVSLQQRAPKVLSCHEVYNNGQKDQTLAKTYARHTVAG